MFGTIDQDGVMHGVSAGTAIFRATATDLTTRTWSLPIAVATVAQSIVGSIVGGVGGVAIGIMTSQGILDPSALQVVNLALQGAKALGVALPQTASASQLMQACAAQGWGELDHSALVRALELMAKHEVAPGG